MKKGTKQLLAFFLLSVLLIKVCVIPVIYLDFEIRRDYIISNLCENRTRPQLNCNGKCYLAKKIAEAKKQDERQAESDFLSKLFSPATEISNNLIANMFTTDPHFLTAESVKFNFKTPFRPFNPVQDIFHPPLS